MKKRIAVVIPCFNESESISGVIRSLSAYQDQPEYTLVPVVVNDCSTDNTLEVIKGLNILFLDLPVNLGIGGAVQSGMRYAFENGYDAAIQFDGDGQHPADQIRQIVIPVIEDNADVVIGSRFLDKEGFQSTYLRRAGIRYFEHLLKLLLGIRISDSTSGFRCLGKKALKLVNAYYPDDYPEPEAVVLFNLNRLNISEVPVNMMERQGGQSSIRGWKTAYYMFKVSLAILFAYIRLKFKK